MSEKQEVYALPLATNSDVERSPTRSVFSIRTNRIRKELTVFTGEFIGTFMFLFLAFAGTQIALESATINPFTPESQNPPPEVSKLVYIAFAFGVGLAINVAIFADVSGAMFNPAVTTSLWMLGQIPHIRALHSIVAQLLAGIAASFTVSAILPGSLPVVTKLDPSISLPRGLLLEMFLTAQLILTILMLPSSSAKPMYIGFTLFVAEICSVYYTGGSLNPARSFGPSVVVGFETDHWIYWVGPVTGGALGSAVFAMINALKGQNA